MCYPIRIVASIVLLGLSAGCMDLTVPNAPNPGGAPTSGSPGAGEVRTLAEARRGFITRPGGENLPAEGVPQPPPGVFHLVRYRAPVGDLAAYLTPDPGDGRKHPAMIWITGGDCNSIGEVWEPAPRENDQSAASYRNVGMVMMFPSLRGGNDNPGRREGFLGEVDDVLAAADHLAAQPYVDPARICLGGHSTGGTLVMLVAEMTDRFRAVFAFGPVADVRGYGGQFVYHQPGDTKETKLRSPGYWLDSVRSPLFVIEGTSRGNIESLEQMRGISRNPRIQFIAVPGADHFGVLAPANEAIAAKIMGDNGPTSNIALSAPELQGIGR